MLQSAPQSRNQLLEQLPQSDYDLIASHLETETFPQGAVLFEPSAEQRRVYFPMSGMVSLMTVMQSGQAIETAVVGREGLVGAMPAIDISTQQLRAIVLLPAKMQVIPTNIFFKFMAESPALADMCAGFSKGLLSQIRTTSACNALHPVNARVCRTLMRSAEVTDSDVLPLTQEMLADVLGVRRTSVTDAAQNLKRQGIISYRRGSVTILNREGLRAQCCECHNIHAEQSTALAFQSRINQPSQSDQKADKAKLKESLQTA